MLLSLALTATGTAVSAGAGDGGVAKEGGGEVDKGHAATPTRESPPVAIEKGQFRNLVHHFRFPVPKGWELASGATAEEMEFYAPGCEPCLLRVRVSPGNTLSLDGTIRAIQVQIAENPAARVLEQYTIKVARESGYTLVKEEPPTEQPPNPETVPAADGASPEQKTPGTDEVAVKWTRATRTRYVTFDHRSDKYYVLLRAPVDRFPADDAALDKLLAHFRFDEFVKNLLR